MLHPEFTFWEFEIEYCLDTAEATKDSLGIFPWWAALKMFDGNDALGWGHTPWQAIACAIDEMTTTFNRTEILDSLVDKLLAGELKCPGCNKGIPVPNPGEMSRLFCERYPACKVNR